MSAPAVYGYVFAGDHEGHAAVLPGHGLPDDVKATAALDVLGTYDYVTTEVFWQEQKRVKWCERHGDPCDENGHWHTHWHALMPSADESTHFTVLHETTPNPYRTDDAKET